ncbi:hypothetical protein P7C70_g8654, partial [Phenoliferia sp. Uapishka_3]
MSDAPSHIIRADIIVNVRRSHPSHACQTTDRSPLNRQSRLYSTQSIATILPKPRLILCEALESHFGSSILTQFSSHGWQNDKSTLNLDNNSNIYPASDIIDALKAGFAIKKPVFDDVNALTIPVDSDTLVLYQGTGTIDGTNVVWRTSAILTKSGSNYIIKQQLIHSEKAPVTK